MSRISPSVRRPRKALVSPPTIRNGAPRAEASRTACASASPRSASLQAVEVGKGNRSGMHVHGPEFRAPRQGRDGLAGVQQAGGIEGGLDPCEDFDLGGGELGAHLIDLLAPDP